LFLYAIIAVITLMTAPAAENHDPARLSAEA